MGLLTKYVNIRIIHQLIQSKLKVGHSFSNYLCSHRQLKLRLPVLCRGYFYATLKSNLL